MTRVVVAGALANKPGNGGEAWVRMTWVRGLQRLGLDVWFVEELAGTAWGDRRDDCVRWFRDVVERFGVSATSTLLDSETGAALAGDSSLVDGADLLVNISGQLRNRTILDACEQRAYVDLDPGYTQVWHDQGADLGLLDHHRHFTVGLAVGRPDCTIPTNGLDWLPILPPVLLEEWASSSDAGNDRFTTVAGWRGSYGTLEHDGVNYGPKAHEFRRLVDLPERVDATLELALAIHPDDDEDRHRLLAHGWHLVDPHEVAGDPDAFRAYLRGSSAEFSVAQPIYVHARTGWFSDRTAHYLAAGRPAVIQDTGTGLASGDGLVAFSTVDEAAAAVSEVQRRHDHHATAARHFAESQLDSAVVLARFLERAGL